jgi:mRNA interferase RelE/StbE
VIKYVLIYSRVFNKSLSKLDKNTKLQIELAVKRLESEYKFCDTIKLTGYTDVYRFRTGDYRILFKKYDDRLLILLLDVKHRREVYRNL